MTTSSSIGIWMAFAFLLRSPRDRVRACSSSSLRLLCAEKLIFEMDMLGLQTGHVYLTCFANRADWWGGMAEDEQVKGGFNSVDGRWTMENLGERGQGSSSGKEIWWRPSHRSNDLANSSSKSLENLNLIIMPSDKSTTTFTLTSYSLQFVRAKLLVCHITWYCSLNQPSDKICLASRVDSGNRRWTKGRHFTKLKGILNCIRV